MVEHQQKCIESKNLPWNEFGPFEDKTISNGAINAFGLDAKYGGQRLSSRQFQEFEDRISSYKRIIEEKNLNLLVCIVT